MESVIYQKAKKFKRKYPLTIGWRIRAHSKVVEQHLNPGEVIKYAFVAQKNDMSFDFFNTHVIVLTNKRILLGQKRILFGYFFTAITPDMFNDLKVKAGLFWGKAYIDTVKEFVVLTMIQKSALSEIETFVTEYMMREKKKYNINASKNSGK